MSQTIQQKQTEYFTKYAGYCLQIWNSIVGQQITHYRHGPGTVVEIGRFKDGICVEVQFAEKPGSIRFEKRGNFIGDRFLRVFTHLTLPREAEKELETRYWDFIKKDLIYELRNLASHASIDQSTFNTFDEIYDRLMTMNQKRKLSEQNIQEINDYQKILMDRMIYELRNLASHVSIDTFYKIYNQLMRLSQKRKLPDQTIQEINGYQKILMDRQRFSDLSEKAMNPNVRAHFPLPELDDDDIQLVGKWYHPPLSNLGRKSLIENHGEDSELGRLLSARSAEKVAMDFYQKYVKEIKDISITQIAENNNYDWKDYDLNVDGLLIDVKNSRESPENKDRYTEHCIPSLKKSRRKNQAVRIAGVLSPYLSASELLNKHTEHDGDAEIRFLGETTEASLQKLKSEFKDLIEAPSSRYFPPWVFDYPQYIYTEQDNARKKLKDFSNFALLKDPILKFDLIPVGIAAGMDLRKILDDEDLDCWEWSFLGLLRKRIRIKEYELSLPFIFLTILAHFLDMAASDKTVSGFKPDKYRRLLFYKRRSSNPLGIYDPLGTVDALIGALSTLWIAEKGLIRKFRKFKLKSSDILQGKSNEIPWTTLIAYCGRCGNKPLVLGESELCEHRRLICPKCDYCCEEWTCKRKRLPTDSTHAAPTGGFKPAGAS